MMLFMIMIVLMSGATESFATTSGNWTLYSGNPVLGPGLGVIFDVSLLPAPSAHGYLMYNSWRTDEHGQAVNAIGLAQSADGFNWTRQSVVLPPSSDPKSWESEVNRPNVVYDERSKRYTMWYTGQTAYQSFIGAARSDDARNWTRLSSSPVLSPNGSTWEKVAVMCPSVIYDPVVTPPYFLYYSGGDQYEPDAIGLAYSDDGVHWTKHHDNPILTANTAAPWEAFKVTAAHIFREARDGWYYAFYIGFADINTASINLARSADGMHNWERHPDNPLITHGDAKSWICDAVYKPYVIYQEDQDRWLLWFNGRCGDVEQIGVAIKHGFDLGFPPPHYAQKKASNAMAR